MLATLREKSRSSRGCGWIQLLDYANGLEKPPAAGCSSNTAPVHDRMEFGQGGMPGACPNSIRSCAEAILELWGPSNAITHFLLPWCVNCNPQCLWTLTHK